MTARKHRRVLLEVVRRAGGSSDPGVKPRPLAPPREPQRPIAPVEFEPKRPPRPTPVPSGDTSGSEEAVISVSRSTLAVAISVVVVLIFVSFSAGKMYGARHPIGPVADQSGETALVDGKPADAVADEPLAPKAEIVSRGPTRESARNETATQQPTPDEDKTARRPQVELRKGYHYIIVQHVLLNQKQAATDIARYLNDHGVPCATLTSNDVQVVATEPFLISQDDQAASRHEKQKADKLLARVREVGAQMNREWTKMGRNGYTLSGAYLKEFK